MSENIFDLVTSPALATFWTENQKDVQPWLGDELFPSSKQLGMDISWFKGSRGANIALRPATLDSSVIPRDRNGFQRITERALFFKESKYIDENLRQQLLMLASSNNPAYQAIVARIFDDQTSLVSAASISREIMRMQALTTGGVVVTGNDQRYIVDYNMNQNHKGTAKVAWDDPKSNPLDDFDRVQTIIGEDEGTTITRAVMNKRTWNKLVSNERIKANILANNANTALASIPKAVMLSYIADNYNIQIAIYDKGYTDVASGKFVKFIPDDIVSFIPNGNLGETIFGTTPEEADLISSNVANVSIVDTGVAITTMVKADPVNVETKVSQFVLPSFENIDSLYILDVSKGDDISKPASK
ncbi:major capsid protein E [Pediococcus stilesii]|uniref:Major capsid protein E n=1 Tax=Pediococcus stilesii TaxID=331679 RepID=A0A5R9BY97_9LACO|nr:major capsid protein [Pediococcus stilesii]TLQ05475.1 major capsid protein E [Pediococcus stilesii]